MVIELQRYKAIYEPFMSFLENNKSKELSDIIPMYSIGTMCPLIVLWHYAIDKFGETEEIKRNIKSLVDFYRYTDIIK